MYRGYEIKKHETLGTNKKYFEIWKDGQMIGFTSTRDDAEIMIDRIISRK